LDAQKTTSFNCLSLRTQHYRPIPYLDHFSFNEDRGAMVKIYGVNIKMTNKPQDQGQNCETNLIQDQDHR